MIKIGVSSCLLYPDKSRDYFAPKTLCYLENDMARFVASEGIIPILLPDVENGDLLQICHEMDGFLFQGGSDIAPETYGEEPIHPDKWHGDPYRDQYELKIMDYAVSEQKPILGICRGFQLLNVYFGGTLYQDIDKQHSGSVGHKNKKAYDQLIHTIQFEPGNLFDSIHPIQKERMVNSIHHQGVKTLGADLEVVATCHEDGMIEAFFWKGSSAGKVIGVQWHPEFFHNFEGELIDAKILYRHFLDFCHAEHS